MRRLFGFPNTAARHRRRRATCRQRNTSRPKQLFGQVLQPMDPLLWRTGRRCGDMRRLLHKNQRARRCVCGNRSHPEASGSPLPCPAAENLRSNRVVPVCTLPYFVYYRKDRKKPIDSPGKRHVKFWSSASAMPFRTRRTLKKTPAGSDPAGVRFYHFKGDSFRNCRVLTAHNST